MMSAVNLPTGSTAPERSAESDPVSARTDESRVICRAVMHASLLAALGSLAAGTPNGSVRTPASADGSPRVGG
jgi:hypothetical protein